MAAFVDPTAAIVQYLSNPAKIPTLLAELQSRTPGAFDVLDHVQGGTSAAPGYNVADDGPLVLVSSMPAGAPLTQQHRIWPSRVQVQAYGVTDEDAQVLAAAVIKDLDGAASGAFTRANADGVPQVFPDDQSEWRIGIVYFTVQARSY